MTEPIQIPIDEQELRRMYIDERLPLWKVCRHFKITKATLYKKLKEFGIKRERYVSIIPGCKTCPTCGKSTMRHATNRGSL